MNHHIAPLLFCSVLGTACIDLKLGGDDEEREEEDDENDGSSQVPGEGSNIGDCQDGLDNDFDGFVDCDDPGCSHADICSNDQNDANNDLSGDGVPDIAVTPGSITFPSLDAAAGLEATEIVIVTNQGTRGL